MLNRTLLFSVVITVVSAWFLFGTSSSVAGERQFFHIDNAIILGQNQGGAHKSPTLGDQIRRMFNKILPPDDHTDHQGNNNQRQAPIVSPPVPVQPPKPVTNADLQQSSAPPGQTQPRGGTNAGNTQTERAVTPLNPRIASSDGGEDSERPPHIKLLQMRERVFTNPEEIQAIAAQQRADSQRAVPLPSLPAFQDTESRPGGMMDGLFDFAEISRATLVSPTVVGSGNQEIFPPLTPNTTSPQGHTRLEPGTSDPFPTPQQPQHQLIAVDNERREKVKQLVVSASPRLEFALEKPPSAVVGQEVIYRIRATNVGSVPAERVTLQVEIPPWIEIRHTDADNGNLVLIPRGDGSGVIDLEWRVNRIDQEETNLLDLRIVPQLNRTIELPMQYDFHRPPIVGTVDIQEPILAMELIGPDEVRWNDFVTYTLIVRNIGNGSAEKLRFELLQTSSEAQTSSMEEPLFPGEGQEIPILVRAGREQEQIDIAIVATGAHELKSEVRRRIKVLRPKLEIAVQTQPLHFVDEPAEMQIRVVNHGNADAENVIIRAELPLGAQHVTSSEGGLFVQQQQLNTIEWRGRSVGKGEVQTFSLTCIPKREGECRVSVEASETNGSVLTASNGTFMAEAIVELDLAVQKPSGRIELGQEVTYAIEVTNVGTKAAEDVEISMMFDDRLEPIAVSGREAYCSDNGQVFFEKIPTMHPKQRVILKVSVEAKAVGTALIRAEVVRADTGNTNVRLEQGLSANIINRQRGAAVAEQPTKNEFY